MTVRMFGTILLTVALLPFGLPVGAQTPVTDGPIPADVQAGIFDFLNDPAVMRFSGTTRIPAGARIEGDVAVVAGSMQLGGVVAGDLLIVNGDLQLSSTATVEGQVVVVGGAVSGEGDAELGGAVLVYRHPLRYRVRSGLIEPLPEDGFAPGFLTQDLGFGQARFTLRAGPNYNRVEGLPVRFGPVIQTGGSNPLTLETFGIWRSAGGLDLDSNHLGYHFGLRQGVGGRGVAFLSASAFDQVAPIETRGLSNAEASLSTFLLHRDYRDYYEREGWNASIDLQPRGTSLDATLSYREEEHTSLVTASPWTLGDSDSAWRPLALVGEGRIRSVELDLEWDSRNDPSEPSNGWWIRLEGARQVGGELRLPDAATPENEELFEEHAVLPRVTRGLVDVRQYARVGPTSRLNLRAVAGGTITGDPLPPQFQLASGGEGSLPGHPRFSLDCGARATTRLVAGRNGEGGEDPVAVFHPAYGCDRMVLFQAELLNSLPLSWNPIPEEWTDSELARAFELRPVWSLFLNASQGWATGDAGQAFARTDSPTRADIGVGFYLGPIGLHWAYPINGRNRGVNFFVRLQQRF